MNSNYANLINPNIFLLNVFVGMITFSIPFLWNAYKDILDKKKYITGQKIENILAREFYKKSIKFFGYFIQYPVCIVVFLGLVVIPLFFPFIAGILFLSGVFIYFSLLPQIFQKIEEKSSTNLKDFILHKEADEPDILMIFKELWQIKDENIEKEFSIKPVHVFDYFAQKINKLLKGKQPLIIKKYFNDFLTFINNRSNIFLVVSKEVFPKILEWHFEIWRKVYEYVSKEEEFNEWINYDEIYRVLDSIFQKIEERALKEREAFHFFNYFKKYEEKYKKEFVISKINKNFYYRDFLFRSFYKVFFKNIEDSPERDYIWKNYFPKEWKITKNNLENEENIISKASLNNFMEWTRDRIWREKEEFDEDLGNVSSNLFPEVSPFMWAPILIFVFSPSGENRAKSVIERTWNFGHIGRIRTFWYSEDNEEEIRKKIREETIKEEENTIELAYLLFKNWFSKENLDKHIKALKYLEYPKESTKENKRIRLLNIFNRIKKYIEKGLEKI